jgi:hypothetical protein
VIFLSTTTIGNFRDAITSPPLNELSLHGKLFTVATPLFFAIFHSQ